jgi:hypothetical protein
MNNLTQVDGESPRAIVDSHRHRDVHLDVAADLPADPLNNMRCPTCGSLELVRLTAKAPHWRQLSCGGCGRFVTFVPTPRKIRRARRYRLDFGAFKGSTLAQLSKTSRGLNYLAWLAREVRGDVGHAAELVLEGCRQ